MIYDNLEKNPKPIVEIKNKISYNFVDGAFVEITGTRSLYYLVKFFNDETGELIYETRIQNNQWARTSTKYFIKWRIDNTSPPQTNNIEITIITIAEVFIFFS
jgi:hypothetical protein